MLAIRSCVSYLGYIEPVSLQASMYYRTSIKLWCLFELLVFTRKLKPYVLSLPFFFSSSTSVSPGLFYLTTVDVSSLSSHFFLPRPSFHLCLICSSCVIRNPSGNCFQIKETRSMTQFYSGMKLCPEIQENMKNTHLDEFSYSYTAEWTVRYDC